MIISRSKTTKLLGNLLIIFFPLTTLLYIIYPIDVLGKNGYLLFVYFIAVIILFLNYRFLLNTDITLFLLWLLGLSFSILLIRTVLFEQNLAEVFENRIILSFSFFLILAYSIDQFNFSSTKNSLLISISLIAFLGILRSFFFPTLFIGEGVARGEIKILEEGITPREFSILGSANAYGVMVCIGLYYIAFKCRESKKKIFHISLFSILFVATFLSESRFPSLLAIFFLISYIGGRGLKKRNRLTLLVIALATFTLFVFKNFQGMMERLGQGIDSGRIIKARLSLELLFQSIESVLIGVSFEDVSKAMYKSITISDNSLLAVGMASGLFIMLLYLFLVVFLVWQSEDRISIGLLSLTYLLYNAIYWDVFVFYLSLLYVWNLKTKPSLREWTSG